MSATSGDVDLNLLRVLDALLEEGSVAGASIRLNLSAPAVSRALGRLRRALDDPLFVRSGRGLVPTPRATALRAEVRLALDQAVTVLPPAPDTLDPSGLARTFAISAGDAITAAFGLRLVETVRMQAPDARLVFLPDTNEAEILRTGEADLDIGSAHGLGNEVESEVLFHDEYCAAMHTEHSLAATELTAGEYAAAEHVVVSSKGESFGAVDEALGRFGLVRNRVTVVSSFIVAAHLATEGDVVALLPRTIVLEFAKRLSIIAKPLPIEIPRLEVAQSWHRRNSNDAAHQWLRRIIHQLATAGLEKGSHR